MLYKATTSDIEVTVEPFYLSDRSDPGEMHFVWGYRITLANNSEHRVQLLSRHWIITDANGKVEEVRGQGVVGEQPELDPGDSFQYTSACPLETPSGIMAGRYTMQDAQGRLFDVEIPAFSLDLPDTGRLLN